MPQGELERVQVRCPGETEIPRLGLKLVCRPAEQIINTADTFTLTVSGPVWLRSRLAGDEMRLPGGTKSLKKIYIDRKIPASQRPMTPVLADEGGVLAVYGIGPNQNAIPTELPAMQFRFQKI